MKTNYIPMTRDQMISQEYTILRWHEAGGGSPGLIVKDIEVQCVHWLEPPYLDKYGEIDMCFDVCDYDGNCINALPEEFELIA